MDYILMARYQAVLIEWYFQSTNDMYWFTNNKVIDPFFVLPLQITLIDFKTNIFVFLFIGLTSAN